MLFESHSCMYNNDPGPVYLTLLETYLSSNGQMEDFNLDFVSILVTRRFSCLGFMIFRGLVIKLCLAPQDPASFYMICYKDIINRIKQDIDKATML